jgi:hypothetical protein
MSLRAKRSNLQPLQIASSLSLLAMTDFWGNSILKFTIILKSFQAEYPSADIKEEFGFEAIRTDAAAIGFYSHDFTQNLFGCDRIIAGGPRISAQNK